MRFWGLITGGLLVWTAHFMGLYLLASYADVAWRDAAAGLMFGLVFSVACLVGVVWLGLHAAGQLRHRPSDATRAFGLRIAVAGALVGGVGVVFQTIALLSVG